MTRTVVFFTDSTDFGGAEQALSIILRELDRDQWQPVLLHHAAAGLAPLLQAANEAHIPSFAVPRMAGILAPIPMLRLAGLLRSLRPAVFHAHLNWPLAARFGLFAAVLARVPAIVATEQLWVPVTWWRSIQIQRLLSHFVGRYIAVSHDLAQQLYGTLHFPAHKVSVVHNCARVADFGRPCDPALRASLSAGHPGPLLLVPARLDQQKGHRYLLDALVHVPGARLILAGDGPERASMEAQVQALDLHKRVVFLGRRQDVPDLLAACDLVVLPSLFEGLPLVVLEAMAAGKPIVATAVGGTPEAVINGETGLLVPPADSTALAQAINTLLSDPLLGARLAEQARAWVQREFSAEVMIQRTTRIYQELLGDNHRGNE